MNRVHFSLSLLFLTLALQASAFSAEIIDRENEFLVSKWTTEEGLPQNSVTSMIQTRDGYIWLTTFGGLARFDGIRFTVFDSVTVPALTSNRLLSIFEDSRGIIWIGAETGEIFFLRNGVLEELKIDKGPNRVNVWGLTEDAKGRVFAASNAGIERFEVDSNGMPIPQSAVLISGEQAFALTRDKELRVWARLNGVYSVVEGERVVPASEAGLAVPDWITRVRFGPEGQAFVGDSNRLGVAEEDKFREILKLDYQINLGAIAIEVGEGALWLQQAGELFEFREDKMQRYDLSEYLDRGSRQILFDREGNIWIASTAEGLIKLSRREITLLSDITGREFINVYSMVEDNAGSIWFANNQVYRLSDRSLEEIEGGSNEALPLLRTLAFDPAGVLWAGGPNGLYFLDSGSLRKAPNTEELDIKALFFDSSERLWLGSERGIGIYTDGVYQDISARERIPRESAHFITQSRDGAVWVGSRAGAYRIADGEVRHYSTKDGLTADYVRGIYEDDAGAIWFATYGGGLSRLKSGKISAITEANGLLNNSVSRMLTDEAGRVWFLTNFGVMAVEREALDAAADGRERYLAGAVFGTADGMPSSEANGGFQSAGIGTSDGRLWFPMLEDVVVIDPRRINDTAPKVAIEGVWSRSSAEAPPALPLSFDAAKEFEVGDSLRNVEISYTGLTFYKPEATRYFYMLEGLDEEWTDAGGQRSVFYPYLPPGTYTFRVKALGGNGVWSENTADLRIIVPRKFWESPWFIVLMIGILALIGYVFLRVRVRQHERLRLAQTEFAKRLLNAHESERRRIAGELHDGLGQNLLLIKNWASMANSGEPEREEVSDYLDKISEAVTDTLEETRTIVHDLGPGNLRRFGLTEAIMNMIEQLEDASAVVFETRVENIDGLFPEDAEISIYRIIQECLNNIVKHSQSPSGIVEIRRTAGRISIRVRDKGVGFEPERDSAKMDGIGLMGISQRVSLLGGELKIDSAEGRGTTVEIEIGIPDAKSDENSDSG